MKEIQLSQGKVALVDDADFDFLNQFKWCAKKGRQTFYATRRDYYSDGVYNDLGKSIVMHRVILGLNDSKVFCDHKDGNGLNNQRENLRVATNGQNMANKKSHINSQSKYKGVSRMKNRKGEYVYWLARVQFNKISKNLGIFKTELDAAIAYNKAAIELHGEFANLNKF